MKQYRITVNGVAYEVEVEELVGGQATQSIEQPLKRPAAQVIQQKERAQAPKPAQTPHVAPVASAGATSIKAPMPGTILKLVVAENQSVKRGDVLCILEAMKMENEIVAPNDGIVGRIYVKEQQNVQLDAPLLDLE
ncbi:biotin/lipoyl-binding protein [Gottschalkiaceae bacterium SANA]|nr:biotin/lipoyl-binding protein [Gottschalkiaceae bacterium SANA]